MLFFKAHQESQICIMAQRSHVPKFGNWEGDNVPYTAFFDNARKEKVGVGMINPNDPSQNPEAFKYAGGFASIVESEVSASAEKSASSDKYHGDTEGHRPHKSMTSADSSSDRSNLDYSVLQLPTHLNDKRSDRRKSPADSRPGPNRLRAASSTTDDLSFRSASVPKFGAWDDLDPKSGEGFTVIFNKVKEEKQTQAAKFPPVHLQYQNSDAAQQQSKTSKRYCCLF